MRQRLRRHEALPPAAAWQAVVEDEVLGAVRLSGWLDAGVERGVAGKRAGVGVGAGEEAVGAGEGAVGPGEEAGGGEVVVLVHGLGGSADSHYMIDAAGAAAAGGLACLRLNLRGADGSGEDFYHAGLTADLHAALASAGLARFRKVYLLGYSLGGHVALRYATEAGDERVAAVAAVCAPLDLAFAEEGIDGPGGWFYRRYLLRRLTALYAAVAARRPEAAALGVEEAAKLERIRDFDELVVAPRHGFTGAADYYARASVGPRLGLLRMPALLVNSVNDPMVTARAVRPVLDSGPWKRVTVKWVNGGHVGFPARLDLELGGLAGTIVRSVDEQVMGWLRMQGGG